MEQNKTNKIGPARAYGNRLLVTLLVRKTYQILFHIRFNESDIKLEVKCEKLFSSYEKLFSSYEKLFSSYEKCSMPGQS